MLSSDGVEKSEGAGTPAMKNAAQAAATSILQRFNKTLDDFDRSTQKTLTSNNHPLQSVDTSAKGEEMLERLLRTQHEKAAQRIYALLHGDNEASLKPAEESTAGTETDEIWGSLEPGLKEGVELTSEQGGKSWDEITHSAYRGVRRIVKDLPRGTER